MCACVRVCGFDSVGLHVHIERLCGLRVRARAHKQNQTHKANLVSDVETQGIFCLALLEALDERFLVELSADEDEAALACLPLL